MPSSGKAYKVYCGPNGEYAESRLQAWRLPATEALVGASVAPASHSDPPSSPVSQRLEGEQQAITPRLLRVLSATRHSPQSDPGAFTSIIQLFEPELQSPVQTRLRGVCLQLTNSGAFALHPTPVVVIPAGGHLPFHSHAEVEKAKQTKAIAKWRTFLKETYPPRTGEEAFRWQFEADMIGGHLAFHQVPADAREAVLQAAYVVAAGPSGLAIDRARCDFLSLEKYKVCKRIDPEVQWPLHGGLLMAFIQWRKHYTTSVKGGYSIAASIKSSFVKGARQLGMQHLVMLDAAVLSKSADAVMRKVVPKERRPFPLGWCVIGSIVV